MRPSLNPTGVPGAPRPTLMAWKGELLLGFRLILRDTRWRVLSVPVAALLVGVNNSALRQAFETWWPVMVVSLAASIIGSATMARGGPSWALVVAAPGWTMIVVARLMCAGVVMSPVVAIAALPLEILGVPYHAPAIWTFGLGLTVFVMACSQLLGGTFAFGLGASLGVAMEIVPGAPDLLGTNPLVFPWPWLGILAGGCLTVVAIVWLRWWRGLLA